MLVIAVAVLGVIGWLIWRASSEKKANAPQVIESPATSTVAEGGTAGGTVTPVPVAATPSIRITPEVADYGTIRKGTRAVRQFEITNLTSTPLSIRRSPLGVPLPLLRIQRQVEARAEGEGSADRDGRRRPRQSRRAGRTDRGDVEGRSEREWHDRGEGGDQVGVSPNEAVRGRSLPANR